MTVTVDSTWLSANLDTRGQMSYRFGHLNAFRLAWKW